MKKRRRVIVVLCIVIALAAWGGVAAYRFIDERVTIETRKFSKEKEIVAKKSYDHLMNMKPDENYPTSPEGVVDYFNEAFYLMYSNSIINDETLFEVLSKQRVVYSEEMKELNPEELQYSHLEESLAKLYADNNICLSAERKGTVYDDENPGECIVQTMIYYNTFGSIYRNYYLVKDDDGFWRINAWKTTDENYSDNR